MRIAGAGVLAIATQLLISAALLGSVATHARAQATFQVSHVRPHLSVADTDLQALCHEISGAAGLRFQIFPNSTLGDFIAVQRKLADGTLGMALQPAATEPDHRLKIGNLPYLVVDWQDAQAKFGRGGRVREAMQSLFAQQGIVMLAVYPQYFGGVSLAKSPLGVDPRSLRVRVPKSQAYFAAGLGYTPVEVAFSEIGKSFDRGLIDGIIGSGAEGYYASFFDRTKWYVAANTHFEVWYLLVSRGRFEELTAKQQATFRSAAAYFESLRWSRAESLQAFNELRLRDAGVKMIRPSRPEIEKIATTTRHTVWPAVFDDIGRAYAESVVGPIR